MKKCLSLLLSLVLVFCMSFEATNVYAVSQADIDRLNQKNAAAQKEIDRLAKEKADTEEYVTALDKKIQIIRDQLNALNKQASELQSSINQVEQSIASNEAQMQEIQNEIDAKQAEFDKIYSEYCQRLRAMYVSGHASNLEVLLTSSDISAILTRSEMIRSISRRDSNTLNELTKKMEEIEKDKAELEIKRIELNENKEKLQTQKEELNANISQVSSSKAELDSQIAEANAAMARIKSETRKYYEKIEDNNAEIQSIRATILANNKPSSGGGSGGSGGGGSGRLGYPTSSRTISAGFPNYPGGSYHGGVDFPVPSGSNIYAADSGTVIIAKNLNYSYGHYLVIDHGNGLSTLYAHNTTLLVGVGAHVNKGQVIALSGSTGNSTGPHCHFEVLLNGNQVNPMNYLR